MHTPISTTLVSCLFILTCFENFSKISWGTKQDDVIESDLGAVIQDSHSQVDVEMLADAADVNRLYEDSLENLKNRKPVDRKKTRPTVVEMEQNAKDYYASVRTNVCFP
jgi:chitin synthase